MAKEQRLIDAEPVKKFIVDGLNNKEPNKAFGHDAIEILAEIEYAPTVDAVEVVRCKDCLYRSQYPDESGHYECGGLLTEDEELFLMVKPDFFCAYGERRGKDAID